MINPKKLKVAIATDSMMGFGGADRMLHSILQIFPNSEIFTSIYNPRKYNIKNKVHTSFIQKIPLPKRILSFLYPLAFETFNFNDFDLVITLTAGPAKGIITKLFQPHITLLFTPTRHQWEGEINVRGSKFASLFRFGSIFLSHYIRIWDLSAVRRMGYVITISEHIKKKVLKIYNIDSKVIYPGVEEFWYTKPKDSEVEDVKKTFNLETEFAISYGRLFDHKNVDVAIKACMSTKTHLYIVGEGPDLGYLKKIANGNSYIHFLGYQNDIDLRALISLSKVFIFPSYEDFGYVTVEAQAQGKPVFLYNRGGSTEIVKDGVTGAFFNTLNELENLISKKAWKRYNSADIVKNSLRFQFDTFKKEILKVVNEIYEERR